MSKIEAYKKADTEARQLKSYIDKALGRDRKDNDKHSFHVRVGDKTAQSWGDKDIWLHASYGYYGSSSGHSATSEPMRFWLCQAINEQMHQLGDRAVELAEANAEKFRIEAEEEARGVLAETAQGGASA